MSKAVILDLNFAPRYCQIVSAQFYIQGERVGKQTITKRKAKIILIRVSSIALILLPS